MTPAQIFQAASALALLGWLLLALGLMVNGGVWRRGLLRTGGCVVPMLLCAVYVAVLVAHLHGNAPQIDDVHPHRPLIRADKGVHDMAVVQKPLWLGEDDAAQVRFDHGDSRRIWA